MSAANSQIVFCESTHESGDSHVWRLDFYLTPSLWSDKTQENSERAEVAAQLRALADQIEGKP